MDLIICSNFGAGGAAQWKQITKYSFDEITKYCW